MVAAAIAVTVFALITAPGMATLLGKILAYVGAMANGASSVLGALGFTKAASILGIIGTVASFGTSTIMAGDDGNWKNVLKMIGDGAAAASKTLTQLGHKTLGQIFDLASSVFSFVSTGLKMLELDDRNEITGEQYYYWKFAPPDKLWRIYEFAHQTAEKIATMVGATRLESILDVYGFVDDSIDIFLSLREMKDPNVHDQYDLEKDIMWDGGVDNTKRWRFEWLSNVTTYSKIVGNVNNLFKHVASLNSLN